VFPLRGDP